MNSRNHIMFGAPGEWVYLHAAGLTQAPDSIGFEHAWFEYPWAVEPFRRHLVYFISDYPYRIHVYEAASE